MEWYEFNVDAAIWEPAPPQPELLAVLKRPSANPAVQLVKRNVRRSVFMVSPNGNSSIQYYLKLDHPQELRNRSKALIRSKTEKEYKNLIRLRKLGIDAPEPVAHAKSGVNSILITKALKDSIPADRLWKEIIRDADPERVVRFVSGLKKIIHVLIRHNVEHRDFHLGNLLVIQQPQAFRFAVVDAVDLQQKSQLCENAILHYLRIVTSLSPTLDEDQSLAFLREFLPYLPAIPNETILWQKIMAGTVEFFYQRQRKRIKRLSSASSIVREEQTVKGRWLLVHDFSLRLAEFIVGAHQCLRHDFPEQLLKRCEKRCVSRIEHVDGTFIVKEFRYPSRIQRFRQDYIAWLNNWQLMMAGFRVPKIYGWLQSCDSSSRSGYIIFEAVDGDNLYNTFRDDPESREKWADELLQYIHRLYLWRCVHRDLKLTNFIVSPQGLYLVDNDAVSFNTTPTLRSWQRNRRHLVQDETSEVYRWLSQWLDEHLAAGTIP